ncbi:protein lin-7 [Schistosoma bovis]|uniref:Protein lin-7 n=1 Tax=Schistosoma bovis TaxID=6184 RepID=A0A430Q1I6_SCHBO|nr:protein lin-7 [Schistosoma bovis]
MILAFNEYFSIIDHTSILTEHNDFIPKPIKQLRDSTLKSSMENVLVKNISIENNNISKEYNLIRRDPKQPPMKQLLKTMLQNKRISGSGKLVFNDEGNLLSVPKLYPVNKRQDESFTTDSHSNESDNNILGNKIPIQWRFVSESYCTNANNNQFGMKMNSELRTARSSISNFSNKVRTRNLSLDLTGATVTPDVIRLQKIKNACINLPNTIDLVDLVAGVTISDGEHLKIGQLTVSSFY